MRRLLIVLILVLCVVNYAHATVTFVQAVHDETDTGTTITVTMATTVTNNTLVVCGYWNENLTISSIGVSAGAASFADSGAGRLARPTNGYSQCEVASGITGGTTPVVTITLNGSSTYSEIVAAEYSASAIDTGAFGTATATSGTTATTGNITPSTTTGATFAWVDQNGAGTTTITGFTNRTSPYPEYFDKIFTTTQGTFTVTATASASVTKMSLLVFVLKEIGACKSSLMFRGVGGCS